MSLKYKINLFNYDFKGEAPLTGQIYKTKHGRGIFSYLLKHTSMFIYYYYLYALSKSGK